MATLTFHPAVLTAALHAGSAAARLAATTTDPDGGGVAIAQVGEKARWCRITLRRQ